MPLLQIFQLHEDESGLGYYRRLSAANALWKWRELASMAQVSRYKTGLFANPEFVASQLDLPLEWARKASKQDEKSRSLHRMHRQCYDAICPCCLDEELYLRQSWEHALITACSKHECLLIEQCTACGGWLSTEREYIELCPCGHDLRTSPIEKAKPALIWLSHLLSGKPSVACKPHIAHAEP
ncbi:MAG: TniQ family protein, partial [Bacteroides sp.]